MTPDATVMEDTPPHRIVLIDGTGYVFRAFYALPPMVRTDGMLVNAVYGFTAMLMRLLEKKQTNCIAVIFDAARRTFRHDIYPHYKANRPPLPAELVSQFGLIRESVRAFNVSYAEQIGFEADDLIATYTRQAIAQYIEVMILSADKDLMQLVGPGVVLWNPLKNRFIGLEQVREKFGVDPANVVDVQALAGDPTDNVPGVPGIGIKIAANLITRFGNLDTLLTHISEITQSKRRQTLVKHTDRARLSQVLVRLRDDVPVQTTLATLMAKRLPDFNAVHAFLQEQAFHSLLARFDGWYRQQSMVKSTLLLHVKVESTCSDTVQEIITQEIKPYSLVQNLSDLDYWLARARSSGVVAVNIATDSIDNSTIHLIGISLAVAVGEACYIPLDRPKSQLLVQAESDCNTVTDIRSTQIPTAEILKRLRLEVLENRGVLKVGHNIKRELHTFHTVGQQMFGLPIVVTPIDDTMILSYVLDGSGTDHSISGLTDRYPVTASAFDNNINGSTGKTRLILEHTTSDEARNYAVNRVNTIFRLYLLFRDRLFTERMVTVHETLERPLIPVLAAMERVGILVDDAKLQALSTGFSARMVVLEAEVYSLAGEPFNIGSPRQLGKVLFERLALPGGRKSARSGMYVTDAVVLEFLVAQGYVLPERVLEWRQLAKLRNTYTATLIACRNRASGRVHTSFAQTVTATGRLSSSGPNLQNIPVRTEDGRCIRRAFIAQPDYVLLSADYSQIELRLLAHVANVRILKDAFRNGIDIHTVTASQIFNVPVTAVNQLLRRRAKTVNFGVIYGISPFGLATQLGLSQGRAKEFINDYFAHYPEIRVYVELTKAQARQHGFVTTPFGRKCQIPHINDHNANTRAFAERSAINAPLQGGAADVIKRAMIRLPEVLATAGLSVNLLLQVHDELVFEVPEAEVTIATILIRSVMESVANLSVPLVVEIGTGRSWDEAH